MHKKSSHADYTLIEESKNILLYAYFGIGDILVFIPILKSLKKKYPDKDFNIITSPPAKEILSKYNLTKHIFTVNRELAGIIEQIKFISKLRKERFDISIAGVHVIAKRNALLSFMSNIPVRIGNNDDPMNFLYTHTVNIKSKNLFDRELELYAQLELEVTDFNNMDWLEDDSSWIDSFLINSNLSPVNFVVISSGAGSHIGSKKILPENKYAVLIRRLLKEGIRIVTIGSSGEKNFSTFIDKEFNGQVVNMIGKTTLSETALIIKSCKLILCNDGGIMHMAAGLKKDMVLLLGPTDLETGLGSKILKKSEYINRIKIIKSNLSCAPCYNLGKYSEGCEAPLCMDAINTDEIFKAVMLFWIVS